MLVLMGTAVWDPTIRRTADTEVVTRHMEPVIRGFTARTPVTAPCLAEMVAMVQVLEDQDQSPAFRLNGSPRSIIRCRPSGRSLR